MASLGNETRIVKHKCSHCGKQVALYDKVASGGVVFLFGKNDGHYGISCPECRKTTLRRLDKGKLVSLRLLLLKRMGRLEGLNQPRLQYNSFPYSTDHLPRISDAVTGQFIKPLGGNYGSLSQDEIEHDTTDQQAVSESYCSYGLGDSAMGPAIAVWWFKKESIEDLLGIENNKGLKVFPRYALFDPLVAATQNLCWKHAISGSPLSKLELSAYPELEMQRSRDNLSDPDMARNREFLSILKYPASQTEAYGVTESEGNHARETDMQALWNAIGENFDSPIIQKELSLLSHRFIDEFSLMARKTDGSGSDAANLRNKHAKILSGRLESIGRKNWEIPSRLDSEKGFDTGHTEDRSSFSSLSSRVASLWRKKTGSNKQHKAGKDLPADNLVRSKKRPSVTDLLKSALKKGKSSEERKEDIDVGEFQDEHESQGLKNQRTTDLIEIFEEAAQTQITISDKVLDLEKRFSSLRGIVTRNTDLMELKYKISEVAKFNTDVLILGETGTGKELFAHAIHQMSGREGNFAPINCSAIPKDLFESELFGHKKGTFSGAYFDKQGAFEYANQGTLFLDEIGEMPEAMQSKILRAVEYRTINRVGSMNPIPLDLRIVFATNRDLKKEVDERRFRKDLFFRIFSPSFASSH